MSPLPLILTLQGRSRRNARQAAGTLKRERADAAEAARSVAGAPQAAPDPPTDPSRPGP